jgi:uncharacterized protein (DUF362 family)
MNIPRKHRQRYYWTFLNNYLMDNKVFVYRIDSYDKDKIMDLLPDQLFQIIVPGQTVVIKPNWVLQSHEERKQEWEQVITHPDVITAVIEKAIRFLKDSGRILIIDGPELNANFEEILSHFPVAYWKKIAADNGIGLEIIDLREELYIQDGNVTTHKIKLSGDPNGKVVINLENDLSEFHQHKKSFQGYYGAGPDITEANHAHDGFKNLYSVSKSVIEADIFINVPKLKTHKKAGITASLKNLVGINTYRNYLPHYSLGTKKEGGDQFPGIETKNRIESKIVPFIKQHFLTTTRFSKLLSPVFTLGKYIFGDNEETIRGGSWHGNDTLWRTILDINKILFYTESDGKLRKFKSTKSKKYITIVDGITAGEGNGPKKPDTIPLNCIFCGSNPVSVDAVCARFMGFNPDKIPTIRNAFKINKYPLVNFTYSDIKILIDGTEIEIDKLPARYLKKFKPHKGWEGHIESL